MTRKQLEWRIQRSVFQLGKLEAASDELVEALIGEGLFTTADLVAIGADKLARTFGVEPTVAERIIKEANSFDNDGCRLRCHVRWSRPVRLARLDITGGLGAD